MSFSPEKIRLQLRKAVLPIVTTARDGGLFCIGTGFLIRTYNRSALMLTASHNIDAVAKVDQPHPKHHPSAIFKVEPAIKHFTNTKPYAIYCDSDLQGHPALIEATSGLPGIDISACQIVLDADIAPKAKFDLQLGLDTRPVDEGERVLVVGYSAMSSETIAVNGDRTDEAFAARFRVVEGKVVGSSVTAGNAPCFGIDVPLEPGMSGGPVFTEDAEGNCYVRGIVRSGFDLQTDGPQNSGRELITAIWPAAMISFGIPKPGEAALTRKTLLDFIAEGVVHDAGKINQRLRVTVSPDGLSVDSYWL